MTERRKSNGYRLGGSLPGHRARIVEFVRGQPQGRSCAEIATLVGLSIDAASTTCWQMVTRSRTLFRGRPAGRRITRYFETQEMADSWAASFPPVETKEQRKAKRAELNKIKAEKAGLVPTVRVRERQKLVGEPIVTAQTKITRCQPYTHDPRYQLPPGERVLGEFSRLGVGRYVA